MVFARYTLGASHDGRIVVEELTPVMDVIPMRHLVAHVANDRSLALTLELDGLTQNVGKSNTDRSPTLAEMNKKSVESLILQCMV